MDDDDAFGDGPGVATNCRNTAEGRVGGGRDDSALGDTCGGGAWIAVGPKTREGDRGVRISSIAGWPAFRCEAWLCR